MENKSKLIIAGKNTGKNRNAVSMVTSNGAKRQLTHRFFKGGLVHPHSKIFKIEVLVNGISGIFRRSQRVVMCRFFVNLGGSTELPTPPVDPPQPRRSARPPPR